MIDYKTVLKRFPSKESKGEFKEYYMAAPSRMRVVDEYKLGERFQTSSSLSKSDVLGVIGGLLQEIERALYDGDTVRLGDLGSFYLSLSSEKCETPEELTASKVKANRVCFRASDKMRHQLSTAKFRRKP